MATILIAGAFIYIFFAIALSEVPHIDYLIRSGYIIFTDSGWQVSRGNRSRVSQWDIVLANFIYPRGN